MSKETDFRLKYHRAITEAAARAYVPYTVRRDELERVIIPANEWQDTGNLFANQFRSILHFDNCALLEGASYIRGRCDFVHIDLPG